MNIISGSSNFDLANSVMKKLNQIAGKKISKLIPVEISKFANDEKRVWVQNKELVHGQEVCLIQSFNAPVDEHIIETLLIVDALERLGARGVTLIIPWLGYSLQDKVFRPGEAIAAKVVADVISNHFVKRVFLLDLHNSSIPGFFSVPTYHLFADDVFIKYLDKELNLDKAIVASPDFGGIKRARIFAEKLGLEMVNIDKSRDLKTGQVSANALHGPSIKNKNVIVLDDVIIAGSTVVESATLLKKEGAKKVYFLASHGIFCQGLSAIEKSPIDQVIVSNSIHQTRLESKKLKILDISSVFAQELLT
jgi:ribose-phosphate pyrophosphokinase